jgi:hypothetical protein
MSDIVERLRSNGDDEAADEIERLRGALETIGCGQSFVVDELNPNRCIHRRSSDDRCAMCHEWVARAALNKAGG